MHRICVAFLQAFYTVVVDGTLAARRSQWSTWKIGRSLNGRRVEGLYGQWELPIRQQFHEPAIDRAESDGLRLHDKRAAAVHASKISFEPAIDSGPDVQRLLFDRGYAFVRNSDGHFSLPDNRSMNVMYEPSTSQEQISSIITKAYQHSSSITNALFSNSDVDDLVAFYVGSIFRGPDKSQAKTNAPVLLVHTDFPFRDHDIQQFWLHNVLLQISHFAKDTKHPKQALVEQNIEKLLKLEDNKWQNVSLVRENAKMKKIEQLLCDAAVEIAKKHSPMVKLSAGKGYAVLNIWTLTRPNPDTFLMMYPESRVRDILEKDFFFRWSS
eukprot:gnl/TRDRNA2_/TRDRNA2_146130_c0_seq1.p1 gnl/TRDRNA2_/TRDRNA2_146130_c0~~gnl/TRDRNA2_/TRDRNA2_146130_c0_seq1.p1  ORF type:complete len:325 (-),score=42.12 gnl/TRDRNA2_/TRDRNA2_146130_c0_seq1:11-985(-)